MLILYIIVVVLAFITGCMLGRDLGRGIKFIKENTISTVSETRVQKPDTEEEKAITQAEKAFSDTENAFAVILGYNADIAYGIKKQS